MSELQDAAAVQLLRQAATIRERCRNITHAVQAERSPHFRLDLGRLDAVADRVAALTRSRFPQGGIPYHSRWRHFEAGGVDRKAEMDALLAGRSPAEVARARIDLALVSVLLDAGAGPQWSYAEVLADGTPGQVYSRSEGLGVASFRAFLAGRFSSDPAEPLRVDAQALRQLDAALLAEVFRADDTHPLVGLEGRAALLRRLGEALAAQPEAFGAEGRPGRLFDLLAPAGTVQAADILKALLDAFSGIWPSG
ncbi:MAG: DUF1688 family protein, partial [Aquincola tertiaricarbonis]